MPQLPSGQYVEIMAERARYHARRLRLLITANTPHRQLYPLIDILIDPGNNTPGCRRCTSFSGHTLADRAWLDQLSEADRCFFLDWLREESQIRVIEQARSRLLAENRPQQEELHDHPQQLYSALQRRIEALTMSRATALQWRRTILNMQRDGVRHEELDWSGLLQYLSQSSPQEVISRDALLAAIDFSPIHPQLSNELDFDETSQLHLREVAQRLPAYLLRMAGYPLAPTNMAVVRYRCDTPDYRIGVIRPQGRSLLCRERPDWFVLSPHGKVLTHPVLATPSFAALEDAVVAANEHARQSLQLRPALCYSTTYEYMSLHGGESYREWLVTLPDYYRSHFTAHYRERNVLLHVRTKVRESVDGTRVLFIEELQSDWQQALSKYGLRRGIPIAPFRKEWAGLALKLMLMQVVKSGLDGIAWTPAAIHEQRYDHRMSALQKLYDQEVPRILNRLARQWQGRVELADFNTRSPWLHAARSSGSWKVEGGAGKFATRPRYDKQQALAVIERHSKEQTLSLPLLRLPQAMRQQIAEHGLPLFGERLYPIP